MDNALMFNDDLSYLANEIESFLNIFTEIALTENQMMLHYGIDKFVTIMITPCDTIRNCGKLQLNTDVQSEDLGIVNVGFSKTAIGNALIDWIVKNVNVDYNDNSIWYISNQLKTMIGDSFEIRVVDIVSKSIYQINFSNGAIKLLLLAEYDQMYNEPCETIARYLIADEDNMSIDNPLTADECVVALSTIASQVDARIVEFMNVASAHGGKTQVSSSYRTRETSFDSAKAVFPNGIAMKVMIENNEIVVELLKKHLNEMHLLDVRKFNDIKIVCDAAIKFATLQI